MSAERLLRTHENNILWIKKRFYFLKKYVDVMEKRTLGAQAERANDTVFQMVHDCYDMLAIDLASLCRGMVERGGFFNSLNNHLAEMKMAKPKDVDVPKGNIFYADYNQPTEQEQDEIEKSIHQDYMDYYLGNNAEAFYKLFPFAKDRADKRITQEDIKNLKNRFYEMAEDLIKDRDGNRAHRFENPKGNKAADVPKLSVEKIGKVFAELEELLNDIRLITSHSTFAYNDMNTCSVEATSEDLIDLVLFGTSIQTHLLFGVNDRLNRHGHPYWPKLREEFYEKLHRLFSNISDKMRTKSVEEYKKDGDYSKIKIPNLPINKIKPKLLDSRKELSQFLTFLESSLQADGLLKSLEQLQRDGSSTAGIHSIEELFTREFLCPSISRYFRNEIRERLLLTDEQITRGLGTEGFQNCPSFGFTPARQQAHFFTKSDVVRSDPPPTWFKSSGKSLPNFQACPDFAIDQPLPFRAVGEVKFFREGSKETAVKELYNATRQAGFYLGAFREEYDAAILVIADASPGHAFKSALDDLQPDLLSRYGEETGVHLTVIGLK